MKNVVAIIPARGGSKGIPSKNLVDFCGKPLLSWSVEQAVQSQSIHSVWVTSDSEAILECAKKSGAQGILRPQEISGDTATSESAWLHAMQVIEEKTGPIDLVVGMQATSPVRETSDLDKAIARIIEGGYDSLFSATKIEDFFIWTVNNGNFESSNYDYKNRKRRQDITAQYVENGSFYLFKPWVIRTLNNRLGGKIGISEMPMWKLFEIDTPESLRMCAALMSSYLLKK